MMGSDLTVTAIPEIHEGDDEEAPPHLTVEIPPEDSISHHSRTRSPLSNRTAQPSPSRGSPSMKTMLHRLTSKFKGSALDTMMVEGSRMSSPSLKGGSLHPFPSSVPATPADSVTTRRLPRSFSAPLNRKHSFFRVVPSAPNPENEDIPEEEAVCRICLTELGEGGESCMKLQCSCKGDLALAHRECAIRWFSVKGNQNCDVCKEQVHNLPVTLLRLQTLQQQPDREESAASRTWTYLAILLVVSVLAYCSLLEILLASRSTTAAATAISLPCGVLLGLLSSFTSAAMGKIPWRLRLSRQRLINLSVGFYLYLSKSEASRSRTVFLYAAVQFGLVLISVYIFLSLFHMQMVASILLATSAGFGVAMFSRAVAVWFLEWRRRRRALAEIEVS